MQKPTKAAKRGRKNSHRLSCRRTASILMLASAFAVFSSPTEEARGNDPAVNNLSLTLSNRVETLGTSGRIPFGVDHRFHVLFSHRPDNFISLQPDMTTTPSRYLEAPRTSGKLLISGGLGKRILTLSAELYDSKTDSWFNNTLLATGRGARASAIPFQSRRMIVWVGLIVPF